MEGVIRTAHHFVNATETADQMPDRFDSVADALARLSTCVTHKAREALSQEVDPGVGDGHRIRAGVDFDSQAPGLWIEKVGICTIDMSAEPKDKRPRKRRFSPENEEKRAEKKVAKLKQNLEEAEEKQKLPKTPRKKREKKEGGSEAPEAPEAPEGPRDEMYRTTPTRRRLTPTTTTPPR